LNETEIIQRFFTRRSNDQSIIVGIGDDGAVVQPPANQELVITTDTIVEGSHFTKQTKPYDIGFKLMAVNLSDLAAMGAKPKWATLNLTLKTVNENWLEKFSHGVFDCAEKFQVVVIGGDLTKGAQVNASAQLIGTVPRNRTLTRSGAQAGDLIFITGSVGLAAYALQKLEQHGYDHACLSQDQHESLYRPIPRIELGIGLRGLATTAIDISDGLLHELGIICTRNKVGANVIVQHIPIAKGVDLRMALTGGDDYELLFTASSSDGPKIYEIAKIHNCKVTQIGTLNGKEKIELYYHNKLMPLPDSLGFDHFGN